MRTIRYLVAACLLNVSCSAEDSPGPSSATADASVPQDAGVDDDAAADASASDAADDADALPLENPDVSLVRELTFEQPPGTNGWNDAAEVIFKWTEVPTGRHAVPDAFVRAAGGINIPALTTDRSYRGRTSVLFTMQDWGHSTYRTDLEMVGNESLSRVFPQGETVLVGFVMRIEHATMPPSGWQLYHQYHNGSSAKTGYGQVNNPALSLIRTNDTDLTVAVRSNAPDDQREDSMFPIPDAVRDGQWVRWVFKTRFENYDSGSDALVEVYSATGTDPLVLHVRVDDRPMGYVYEDPTHSYEVIIFDLYGSPMHEQAEVYLDEVRIAEGDLPPSVVDPMSWVSYQHPLNQPYDADLDI